MLNAYYFYIFCLSYSFSLTTCRCFELYYFLVFSDYYNYLVRLFFIISNLMIYWFKL